MFNFYLDWSIDLCPFHSFTIYAVQLNQTTNDLFGFAVDSFQRLSAFGRIGYFFSCFACVSISHDIFVIEANLWGFPRNLIENE